MDATWWIAALTAAAGTAAAVGVVRAVQRDGHGTRPGPASHHGTWCGAPADAGVAPCDCR